MSAVSPALPAVRPRAATEDSPWVRAVPIGVALAFLGLFLLLPLLTVFLEAFAKGLSVYRAAIVDPAALSAIRLTLLVAAISVPANAIFGVAAAWAIEALELADRVVVMNAGRIEQIGTPDDVYHRPARPSSTSSAAR